MIVFAECLPLFTPRYEQKKNGMFEALSQYGFDLPDKWSDEIWRVYRKDVKPDEM
jgi:hypothetical protein